MSLRKFYTRRFALDTTLPFNCKLDSSLSRFGAATIQHSFFGKWFRLGQCIVLAHIKLETSTAEQAGYNKYQEVAGQEQCTKEYQR